VNVPDENPSALGVFEFALRFPGQYFDKETNLHYNYFRDYDPSLGRYSQSDPIGLEGGVNTYLYVDGVPILTIDPAGLCPMAIDGDWWLSTPTFTRNSPKWGQCALYQQKTQTSGYLLWSEGSCNCETGTMKCVYSVMYQQYDRQRPVDCKKRIATAPWGQWQNYWQVSEWGVFMLTYDCKADKLGKPGKKLW
jgi:RHS repeat-associated protein